jgi:serine/threonine protein kinase
MEAEANLLATMDHSHIITVYAKSASGTKASKCTEEQAHDFFLVMDRLSSTLNDKIAHWKREKRRLATKPLFHMFDRHDNNGSKKKKLLVERLHVAHDVASAIGYLHEQRIVYRDLKADNVGFDVNGKSKLFDFGLARRMPSDPKKKRMNDTYVMTGRTGSLPFMAPEVWNRQPYNEKVDVYSFAILLWQILSLEIPYLELAYDLNDFTKQVMIEGHRPTIDQKWPEKLQSLLRKAWSKDMDTRPSMNEVCAILKKVIASAHTTAGSQPSLKRSSFM